MSTPRQIEANRKNAQKSTGPRSEAGKRASARNALRHGAYTAPNAITIRPWFEDPEEVNRQMDDVVASLSPRTEAEARVAQLIAETLLRSDRLAEYETAMLAHRSTREDTRLNSNFDLATMPESWLRGARTLITLLELGRDYVPTSDDVGRVSEAWTYVISTFVVDEEEIDEEDDPWARVGYPGFDHKRQDVGLDTAVEMIWTILIQEHRSEAKAIEALRLDLAEDEGIFIRTLREEQYESSVRCLDVLRNLILDATDRVSRQLQRNLVTYERMRKMLPPTADEVVDPRNEPNSREE